MQGYTSPYTMNNKGRGPSMPLSKTGVDLIALMYEIRGHERPEDTRVPAVTRVCGGVVHNQPTTPPQRPRLWKGAVGTGA